MTQSVISILVLFGVATAAWSSEAASSDSSCKVHLSANYSKADAERYIRAGEAEWAASVATSDASILKRILADDFVWVLDDRVLDKPTAVREAEDGPGKFVSNRLDYAHIRFFGATAVVQGREHWVKRDPHREGHFIWTDTWMLCGGTWKIVNSQDTEVVDSAK